jgi:phenylpropionate dioxygenase-like ring-hydroxylating dioxygenase large terminal subunit
MNIRTSGLVAETSLPPEDAAPVYLRNAWYAALGADDLGEAPVGKVLLEEEIALYRTSEGLAVALGDRCPHRFVELHGGKVVGDNLQCPYHGLQFNASGACAFNPHGNGHRPAAARSRATPWSSATG